MVLQMLANSVTNAPGVSLHLWKQNNTQPGKTLLQSLCSHGIQKWIVYLLHYNISNVIIKSTLFYKYIQHELKLKEM